VVVVPKGTFLSGALFFKQGCDLQIEKEGVLKGSSTTKTTRPYSRAGKGSSATGPPPSSTSRT